MDLARNLKVESVARLQPTPPHHIDAAAPVRTAVERMRAEGVGCLLVCEENRLAGVFTERDLMVRVLAAGQPLSVPISEVMSTPPVTVQLKDSISAAVRRMVKGGYRHLPVVDEFERPVGVLSVKRIVRYLVEHFPGTVYNLPPDPAAVPKEREGA